MEEKAQKSKLVVRKLPPTLPKDIFRGTLSKWDNYIAWFDYIPGKQAKSNGKGVIYSRAYLSILNPDVLLDFCRNYNGHGFQDSQGNKYRAIVEFAPFQRYVLPGKKLRLDRKVATLEEDEEYKEFIESIASNEKQPPKPNENDIDFILANRDTEDRMTPLLLAIQRKKARASKGTSRSGTATKESSQGYESRRKKKGKKNLNKKEGPNSERSFLGVDPNVGRTTSDSQATTSENRKENKEGSNSGSNKNESHSDSPRNRKDGSGKRFQKGKDRNSGVSEGRKDNKEPRLRIIYREKNQD